MNREQPETNELAAAPLTIAVFIVLLNAVLKSQGEQFAALEARIKALEMKDQAA
jgi:hypothetical protein